MTLQLSTINSTRYSSTQEHQQELAQAGNDQAILQAIDAKFKRSWAVLKNTSGAQAEPVNNRPMGAVVYSDGSGFVGDHASVTKAQIDAANQKTAATKDSTASFERYRSVVVKSR